MTNDNDNMPKTGAVLDAHGQAALLLVESLIHGLVERSVVIVAEAVEIIDIASEVAAGTEDASPTMQRSATLLRSMSKSLSYDLMKDR